MEGILNIFSRMLSVEFHTVISQVRQTERGLLLDVMSVMGRTETSTKDDD